MYVSTHTYYVYGRSIQKLLKCIIYAVMATGGCVLCSHMYICVQSTHLFVTPSPMDGSSISGGRRADSLAPPCHALSPYLFTVASLWNERIELTLRETALLRWPFNGARWGRGGMVGGGRDCCSIRRMFLAVGISLSLPSPKPSEGAALIRPSFTARQFWRNIRSASFTSRPSRTPAKQSQYIIRSFINIDNLIVRL